MVIQRLAQMTGMSAGPSIRPDWNAVRSALGFDVPGDYKELIDDFGAGALNDFVLLLGPGEPVKLYNLVEHGLYWDGYLREIWENSPRTSPRRSRAASLSSVGR
ncbi:hypothetical protein [Glycomyces rhizosphaerae]|uniref:SMI1/KNR4 family protein n=1 Tax=Glycomyces rhizosphaerae TaxID=2054422 RepID=A0ABV7PVT6_9ACTN